MSGQEAGGEGAIREKPEPPLAAQGQYALLDVAVEQVVWSLIGGERSELEGAGELEMGRIAEADGMGFARVLEPVQRVKLPLPALAHLMQLNEVDVLGL